MEPEVHIIEKWFQEIHGCFTMTNIRCKGGKEIDLLALNPLTNQRYHVEARVSTTFPLCLVESKTKSGKPNKNGVDYFAREKFNHPFVLEKVKEYFGENKYEKLLVVYSIKYHEKCKTIDERNEFFVKADEKYGISVALIGKIIKSLSRNGETMGSRDDVIRLIELITAEERMYRIERIRFQEKNYQLKS